MKVKDVMTRPVLSIEPGTSVQQAAQLMLQRRISGLPVIDNLQTRKRFQLCDILHHRKHLKDGCMQGDRRCSA